MRAFRFESPTARLSLHPRSFRPFLLPTPFSSTRYFSKEPKPSQNVPKPPPTSQRISKAPPEVYETLQHLENHIASKNFDQLEKSFQQLWESGKSHIVICNRMIKHYGKREEWKRLEELVEKMRVSGPKPSDITHSDVLQAFLNGKKYEEGERYYAGIHGKEWIKHEVFHSSYLMLLSKTNQKEKLEDHCRHMKSLKLKPNAFVASILVNFYGKRGEIEKMEDVYEEMKEVANEKTLTSLIEGYGKADMIGKMLEVVKHLLEEEELTTFTLNSVLVILGKKRMIQAMMKLLHLAENAGVQPNALTFEILLQNLGKMYSEQKAAGVDLNLQSQMKELKRKAEMLHQK